MNCDHTSVEKMAQTSTDQVLSVHHSDYVFETTMKLEHMSASDASESVGSQYTVG